jgi:hypothetical protein
VENYQKALTIKTCKGQIARLMEPHIESTEQLIWINHLFSKTSYTACDILKIINVLSNSVSSIETA